MPLATTKDLAQLMQLHARTVKRWWKKLGVPPDACNGNGCHRWTPEAVEKLLTGWKHYWASRDRSPEVVKAKAEGRFSEAKTGQLFLPLSPKCPTTPPTKEVTNPTSR